MVISSYKLYQILNRGEKGGGRVNSPRPPQNESLKSPPSLGLKKYKKKRIIKLTNAYVLQICSLASHIKESQTNELNDKYL